MTIGEVIEILKESPVFGLLTSGERDEAINHAVEVVGLGYSDDEIKEIVGEVFLAKSCQL